MTNEKRIWDYLLERIGNEYGVAGLIGNLYVESNLNPKNLQGSYESRLGFTDESYTQAVDSGTYGNFATDHAGYGLAQWTYHTRKQALFNYARIYGESVGDLGLQLDFLWEELQGYKRVLATLKTAVDVATASNCVMLDYERPANQTEENQRRRASICQTFYDKYHEEKETGNMKIIESILTKNPCYKSGKKITVKGLMLHSVGCPQPSASVFVKKWNNASYNRACVHAFIDGNTGDVYQTLPWNHRGWHCGADGNNTHIGVEMCEPSNLKYTGGSNFTCTDTAKAKEVVTRTYNSAVQLFADLCKQYHLDPLKDGVILSHSEGRKRGIASNHADPEHLWKQLKTGYTMDGFRADVKKAMTEDKPNEPTPDIRYCVQVGAFSKKSNAEKQLEALKKAGFDGYITVKKKTS